MTVSVQNSVVIALAQTVVLVIGILGIAASNKLASKMGYPSLGEYLFFFNYGWLLMPVPLIWITVTGWFLPQRRLCEVWKTSVFMAVLCLKPGCLGAATPGRSQRESALGEMEESALCLQLEGVMVGVNFSLSSVRNLLWLFLNI